MTKELHPISQQMGMVQVEMMHWALLIGIHRRLVGGRKYIPTVKEIQRISELQLHDIMEKVLGNRKTTGEAETMCDIFEAEARWIGEFLGKSGVLCEAAKKYIQNLVGEQA